MSRKNFTMDEVLEGLMLYMRKHGTVIPNGKWKASLHNTSQSWEDIYVQIKAGFSDVEPADIDKLTKENAYLKEKVAKMEKAAKSNGMWITETVTTTKTPDVPTPSSQVSTENFGKIDLAKLKKLVKLSVDVSDVFFDGMSKDERIQILRELNTLGEK